MAKFDLNRQFIKISLDPLTICRHFNQNSLHCGNFTQTDSLSNLSQNRLVDEISLELEPLMKSII